MTIYQVHITFAAAHLFYKARCMQKLLTTKYEIRLPMAGRDLGSQKDDRLYIH